MVDFDISEILLKHLDIVLALLDDILFKYKEENIYLIIKTPKSREIQNILSEINNFPSIPLKKNEKITSKVNEILPTIMPIIKTFDYSFKWVSLSANYLNSIFNEINELDFNINTLTALRICKLFIGICKICVLINSIKAAKMCLGFLLFTNECNGYKLLNNIENLVLFAHNCINSPFMQILSFVEQFKSRLISFGFQFFNLFSLFGEISCFDWNALSVYGNPPTSYQKELKFVSHLCPLQEMMVFFLFLFSSDLEKSFRFKRMVEIIFSECRYLCISKSYIVSAENLFKLASPSMSITLFFESLNENVLLKNMEIHMYRIRQLYYFSFDLENFLKLDISTLLCYMNHIQAIIGFSYYEIEVFFKSNYQIEKLNAEDIYFLFKLIQTNEKILHYLIKNQNYIKYFFLYNISTTDKNDLNDIIEIVDLSILGNIGIRILDNITLIINEIKGIINEDIHEINFDLYPLILTIGRIIFSFNFISGHNDRYLNPLLKQLGEIYFHCQIAQNPFIFLLELFPIHKFWIYSNQLPKILSKNNIQICSTPIILKIFSYFKYDSQFSAEVIINEQKSILEKIKEELLLKISSMISELLSPNNLFMKYLNIAEIGKYFDQHDNYDEQQHISKLNEIYHFFTKLPNSIILINEKIEISQYFIDGALKSIISLLIQNLLNGYYGIVIEAYQFIWPLFILAKRNLYQYLFYAFLEESIFISPDISIQAKMFTGHQIESFSCLHEEKRFIYRFTKQMIQFIESEHQKTKYIPFIQLFKDSNINYSTQFFVDIFRIFGMHGALYLDSALTKSIIHNIFIIMSVFRKKSPFKINKDLIHLSISSSVIKASNSLLNISVSLIILSMIRRAFSIVNEESLPGFNLYLYVSNNQKDKQNCTLLNEISSRKKSIQFIKDYLSNAEKCIADLDTYFIFLGSLFGNPKWDKIQFFSDEDALSYNLHLLPFGFELMVEIAPLLFENADEGKIKKGINVFFNVLKKIADKKIESTKFNESLGNPFLILVDKFPRYIQNFEYGNMESVFPYSLLLASYPATTIPTKKGRRNRK